MNLTTPSSPSGSTSSPTHIPTKAVPPMEPIAPTKDQLFNKHIFDFIQSYTQDSSTPTLSAILSRLKNNFSISSSEFDPSVHDIITHPEEFKEIISILENQIHTIIDQHQSTRNEQFSSISLSPLTGTSSITTSHYRDWAPTLS